MGTACCAQALEASRSLEEVTTAHSKFVDAAQRQCLLAPDKTWKLIEGVVVQILNQVLHFADLQQKLRKPVGNHLCCGGTILTCLLSDAHMADVSRQIMR